MELLGEPVTAATWRAVHSEAVAEAGAALAYQPPPGEPLAPAVVRDITSTWDRTRAGIRSARSWPRPASG
jgi:hypothetical protein